MKTPGSKRFIEARSDSAADQGFTLIELLMVIAIVAIMAAILLPALNRAKQSAHLATCASNLRQIELATTLYVMDNGAYPFYWTWNSSNKYYDGGSWSQQLAGYLSNPQSGGVYRCPNTPNNFLGTRIHLNYGGPIEWDAALTPCSYGVNVKGTDILTPRGIYGAFPELGTPLMHRIIPPLRDADILAPSDMIAFGDASIGLDFKAPPTWSGFFDFPYNVDAWYDAAWRSPGFRVEAQRHHGLFNVAFCDAHVEALRPDKLYGTAPDLTKRWNRDHQSHTDAWK